MALPPLDERSTQNLLQQLENLRKTYDNCAKILSPTITPSGARALDRINDAIEAIEAELKSRGA